MTSQRDETVGSPADDDLTDDPIIVERHDEILVSSPAEDTATDDDDAMDNDAAMDDAAVPGTATDDTTVTDDDTAVPDAATDDTTDDGPAGDELTGRHAAPEASDAGSAPLVVPAEPGPASEGIAGQPDGMTPAAAVPGPGGPETPGTGPAGNGTSGTPVTGDLASGASGDGVPAAALAGQQWPAIQAMFVDDPKGSVQRAAAAADEAVRAFVASLEREQTALRAAWENDTSTEDLRTALQQYRAFCGRLESLA